MTKLEIILSIVLFISVLLNGGLVFYARTAIVQLLSISEELNDLAEMTNSLALHLQSVYELESFYGDEILQNLLEHAVSFNEQLDTFEYIYSLTQEDNKEIDTDFNDDETETETETEKT
jgi:hypothetical protein|tara:strand:- start:482 stop:838 length:357 start_codon:yes stop_codon:yes gene_type:complete